jgi:hypothetical protein
MECQECGAMPSDDDGIPGKFCTLCQLQFEADAAEASYEYAKENKPWYMKMRPPGKRIRNERVKNR